MTLCTLDRCSTHSKMYTVSTIDIIIAVRYLRNVLDECDDQLDVGEDVEKVEPREFTSDSDKERDDDN